MTQTVAVVTLAVEDTVEEMTAEEVGVVVTLTVGVVDTFTEGEDESENDPLTEMVWVEELEIVFECMPLALGTTVVDVKAEGEMP